MPVWDTNNARALAATKPNTGAPVGFGGEAFGEAFEFVRREEQSVSLTSQMQQRYDSYLDGVEAATGERLANPMSPFGNVKFLPDQPVPMAQITAHQRSMALEDLAKRAGELRQLHPDLPMPPDPEEALLDVIESSADLRQQYDVLRSRMTAGGATAAFLGSMAGAATDPPVLATLPFGAAAGTGILGTMAAEAAIATATEIPIQAIVFDNKRTLGSPYTATEAAINVLTAGAGAAGLAGLIKGIGRGGSATVEAWRRHNAPAAGRATRQPSAQETEAATILEREAEIASDSPLPRDVAGDVAHQRAFTEAYDAATAGRPVQADVPATAVRPDVQATGLERLDPDEIEVDAETFQFKSGADVEGVTERLQGVQEFDERLAGVALVYEGADGRQFIVDGHQRLALAKRAKAAGQQDVALNAFMLREADGVSTGEARAVAAFKNIAEGTGTSLDAAKVIREVGARGLPPLPPRSALVRDAEGLSKLGPDAFGMAVNDVVPAQHAALVGRLVPDVDLQASVMQVLARVNPDTLAQAETVIRDASQASAVTKQETLFGEEFVTESLFGERARVLESGLRQARKDLGTFRTLVRERGRAEAAGNVLDPDANAQRLSEDAQIIQAITSLATRTGAVSDALTAQARALKEGKKLRDAAGDFLEAVRRADHASIAAGADVGPSRLASEAHAQEPLDLFGGDHAQHTISDPTVRAATARATVDRADTELDQAINADFERVLAANDGDLELPGELRLADDGAVGAENVKASDLMADVAERRRVADEVTGCATTAGAAAA